MIYEVGKDGLVSPRGLPKGTRYTYFNKSKDLKIGVKVFASLFAGKRIGIITSTDSENFTGNNKGIFCQIDGKDTYISDIQWKILS